MERDSARRSVVKALTYRTGGVIVTSSVAWLATGQVQMAVAIGAADTAVKLALYYLHERAWNRIGFGRARSRRHRVSMPMRMEIG